MTANAQATAGETRGGPVVAIDRDAGATCLSETGRRRGPRCLIAVVIGLVLALAPLAGCRPTQPGEERAAPDFKLLLYDGNAEVGEGVSGGGSVTLSEFRGKSPVVVNFWAVWCGPCRTEMPALNSVYERYEGQGLVVLGVDMGAVAPEQARAFLGEVGVRYAVGVPESTRVGPDYGVTGLPTTVFVARDGTLLSRWVGPIDEKTLSEKVEELLLR